MWWVLALINQGDFRQRLLEDINTQKSCVTLNKRFPSGQGVLLQNPA